MEKSSLKHNLYEFTKELNGFTGDTTSIYICGDEVFIKVLNDEKQMDAHTFTAVVCCRRNPSTNYYYYKVKLISHKYQKVMAKMKKTNGENTFDEIRNFIKSFSTYYHG